MDGTRAWLEHWMPQQRWFAGKGTLPRLRILTSWDLASDGDRFWELLLVADDAAVPAVRYQVPVVRHRDAAGADVFADGASDPDFHAFLYEAVTRGVRREGVDGPLVGEPARPVPATDGVEGAVLSGEQSNTSIVLRPRSGEPAVICKIFRQVHEGVHPDIELQSALSGAGAVSVPPTIGTITATWREGSASHTGAMAFAQEFFPGVQDAWRVALAAAAAGRDFTADAARLGAAVAETHVELACLFPVHEALDADRALIAAGWEQRLALAVGTVPGLAPHIDGIRAAYAEAAAAPWPALQRVHGDLHLGQVLDVPGRGWVLLDFEGEPLRPMSERRAPDSAVRDVAGMLRSFDYVAGSVPGDAVQAWATAARNGFLSGYAAHAGAPDARLLRAFEVDKAVYETVYEARNRPDWLRIPLSAVARLAAG